jgi:xanthine dehydrogenase small subunit
MNDRNYIEFLLGFEKIQIRFGAGSAFKPTTTLLQYLRADVHHKGTKEGCAQGDCGACTVVITSVENNKLNYKAVNACLIFLPQLHGKQIITVEYLVHENHLHPVQQAMVDLHASQCGFCTPGFIMSLFALYKSPLPVEDKTISNSLAGNLCRCTGYRSIMDATHSALSNRQPDRFSRNESITVQTLSQIIQSDALFENGEQKYFAPIKLETALNWRKENPSAIIINGATDVALKVTKLEQDLNLVLDLSGIECLDFCNLSSSYIEAGAGLSLEKLRMVCSEALPKLFEILSVFGSKQIRNLATLGGNITAASPIGDTLPLLMALDARLTLQNKERNRVVSICDFITGYRQTQLQIDEFLVSVKIPVPADMQLFVSKISKRNDMDIATCSAAMLIKLNNDKMVETVRLFYGGMGATTTRASNVEKMLLDKPWNLQTIEDSLPALELDFKPISDARATAEGRMELAKNILIQFWEENKKPII